MMKRSLFLLLSGVLLVCLCGGTARADGPSRPVTQEERAFFLNVTDVCNKAIPAPFPEWREDRRSAVEAPELLGTGVSGPLRADFAVEWTFTKRSQEYEASVGAMAEGIAKDDDRRKRVADMDKRIQDISAKLSAAAEAGNVEEMQRWQAEMEKIAGDLDQQGREMEQKIGELAKEKHMFDSSLRLTLLTNGDAEDLSGFQKSEPWQGCPVYVRSSGDGESADVTLVFAGAWREGQGGQDLLMNGAFAADRPATAVQNVLIRITAHAPRARELLKVLNWEVLKGLLAGK